jgi:hypothetical protein
MVLLSWILSFLGFSAPLPLPLFASRPNDDLVLTRREKIVVPAPIVVSPSQYLWVKVDDNTLCFLHS